MVQKALDSRHLWPTQRSTNPCSGTCGFTQKNNRWQEEKTVPWGQRPREGGYIYIFLFGGLDSESWYWLNHWMFIFLYQDTRSAAKAQTLKLLFLEGGCKVRRLLKKRAQQEQEEEQPKSRCHHVTLRGGNSCPGMQYCFKLWRNDCHRQRFGSQGRQRRDRGLGSLAISPEPWQW